MRHRLAKYLVIPMALLLSALSGSGEEFTTQQLAKKFTPCVMLITSRSTTDPSAGGSGTGFLLSADGMVATNYHVIDGCDKFEAKSASGGNYTVKRVLAGDKAMDLAILQIEGSDLPVVELADSDTMEPGMKVVVIGHPLGMGNSVTEGIVSAVNTPTKNWGKVIQISAAITHGSSGSPVFNSSGKVIGMGSGGEPRFQAMNFAIPSNKLAGLLKKAQVAAKDAEKKGDLAGGDNGYVPDSKARGSREQDNSVAKDDRYRKLKSYEKNSDYFGMLSVAKQLVKDNPQSALAYRALTEAYYDTNMPNEAIDAASKAVDLDPENPRGWNNLGFMSYSYRDEFKNVLAIYAHAVQLAPDDAKLLIEYAGMLGKGEKWTALSALKHARELLINDRGTDMESQDLPLFARAVNGYVELGQGREAYDVALDFLHKTTTSADLYVAYANAAVKSEHYTYVKPALDKACQMDPRWRYTSNIVLGDSEYKQGNTQGAINYYKQSYAIDPSSTRAISYLCYAIVYKDRLTNTDLEDLKFYVAKIAEINSKEGTRVKEAMMKILDSRRVAY